MSSSPASAARVEQLRSSAARAHDQAAAARALALAIERRRALVLRRDDPCVARHTPDAWSSAAADASRTDLRAVVGFSLWATSEALIDTRFALERRAQELDASASSYRRQAESVHDALLAALAAGDAPADPG